MHLSSQRSIVIIFRYVSLKEKLAVNGKTKHSGRVFGYAINYKKVSQVWAAYGIR